MKNWTIGDVFVENITIISSATHVGRSVSLLKLIDENFAKRTNRKTYHIYNVSWLDVKEDELKEYDIFGTTDVSFYRKVWRAHNSNCVNNYLFWF